jgi:tetraprenyl-beta-curcumene synthase
MKRLTVRDLLAGGMLYWSAIYPPARREIECWHRRAAGIEDATLRALALQKLTTERLNPEAAALFASTAPQPARTSLISLIVAYQILYDYLDAVNEMPGSRALANGLQLHRALTDATRPGHPMQDLYRHNPQHRDSSYAKALGSTCMQLMAKLPSRATLSETVSRAAERCRQAQARNHAISDHGASALQEWCRRQAAGAELLWWETAAAGISCLGVHALLATAADRLSTQDDGHATDAAYFPGVCAISALLDSLADHHSDQGTSNHSFTARYETSAEAATRLIAITRQTSRCLGDLRRNRRHVFILWGILAFYLSAPTLHPSFSEPVGASIIGASGTTTRVMRAAMKLRRHIAAQDSQRPE